jgi:hypothetical protein
MWLPRPVNSDVRRLVNSMVHLKTYALILEEFRQKATGKVPFGPVDDLQQLYESLNESERPRFLAHLDTVALDQFWSPFVKMFKEWREKRFP